MYNGQVPVHVEVLDAARRIADGSGVFGLAAVVAALPHLNAATVRTHVASRCCTNAPRNHQSRYPYFRAMGGGRYRIEPRYRAVAHDRTVPSQDRLIKALGSGTDLTLVDRSLRMTPTERLETMRRAALSLDAMRT
jgi:hypothetical protein